MNKSEIKLKVIAEEIKEILRKHDVAGAVSLHTPGHGEHFVHLTPSYSCVYVVSDNEIRIHSKKENYKSREEQHKKQEDSANMLHILTHVTAMNFHIIDSLYKKLEEITEIKHFKP